MDFIIGDRYFNEYGGTFIGNINNSFYFLYSIYEDSLYCDSYKIDIKLKYINKGNFVDYFLPSKKIFKLIVDNTDFIIPFKYYISNNLNIAFLYNKSKIILTPTTILKSVYCFYIRKEEF